MTANQINYWGLQETKRHNVATETETNRHNVATEGIDLGKLQETTRHNIASERLEGAKVDISRGTLNETVRHNMATEANATGQLSEARRHNIANEKLQNADLNIQSASLSEDRRHNVANEGIEQQRVDSYTLAQESIAKLNDVKRTWEDLLNSSTLSLNKAQRDKIQAEIDKLSADVTRTNRQSNVVYWSTINDSINSLSHIIDSLIPG